MLLLKTPTFWLGRISPGIDGKIKSAKWTDNGEELRFEQNGTDAKIFATGFPYGTSLVVRVAELELE